MASTLPQPLRPATNPPNTALPPLPIPKSRKNLQLPSESPNIPSSLMPSKLRTPSASPRPSAVPIVQLSSSISSLMTPRSTSASRSPSSPEKTLRRTVSIAAFPHPPKAGGPLSLASSSASLSQFAVSKSRSPDLTKPVMPASSLSSKKALRSSNANTNSFKGGKMPVMGNSSVDGKSIPNTSNTRNSEGHFSIPSPPQSRSSSAQGSYSTSATTCDDLEDGGRRGREVTDEISGNGNRTSRAKEGKGNVIVSVRVRPDNVGAEHSKSEGEWMVDGRRSLVSYRGKEGGDYYYDNVFAAHDNNAKVYDASAKRLVRRVMEGYHGTVFAYGMTGTGKTFSMQGTASSPGVIPLAITDIFSYIRETPHREFLLRVSYLEIYNEKIHDLLSPPVVAGVGPGAPQQEEIKLREDSKRGVYASPLKEEIVQSPTQLLRVIARGDHSRRTGSTQYNTRSSRSHAVVQIVVESRERVSAGNPTQEKRSAMFPGGVRVSTLSLIDLAGSERAAESKERRTEGAHINKSLLTLGTVIARLSGEKDKNGNPTDRDGKHLPYRDSKLTRLLQPALSGNSLVSILCTIQIGSAGSAANLGSHTGETLNTLKFAARAKNNIISHAKRAEEALFSGPGDAGSRVLLERYRMEIQSLRAQLDGQAKAQCEKELKLEEKLLEREAESRHEEQMLEMQLARTALKERIEHLNRLILCSKSTGVNTSGAVLGRISGLSVGANESGLKSLRSSASQSTLGAVGPSLNRSASMLSVRSGGVVHNGQLAHGPNHEEEEDTMGEFGDGMASLQMQINALQADLADKNRYISTLERRLLQARRSSHSRMSMGISHLKGAGMSTDDPEIMTLLREKDMEISELRIQLDDKDRMVAALRSAARQREVAQLTPDSIPSEIKHASAHQSNGSNGSSHASGAAAGGVSPVTLLSPLKMSEKEKDKKRKSVDEMSRMLDEMIQDRVESGHLIKGSRGSVRVASGSLRESLSGSNVPALSTMVATLRGSVADIPSS